MTKSLASNIRQAAPTNWRSKSSPEGLEMVSRGVPSTQKGGSETNIPTVSLSQRGTTNIPPKTFQDILPPQLITTSTLSSETSYMGYRKSKFKTTRSSTLPVSHRDASQTLEHVVADHPTERSDPPTTTTSRRLTLKRMKGVMSSIKRSISTLNKNDSKKKIRPPIPFSSAFAATSTRSRFGTGPGRQTFGRQDGGYLNLPDGEVAGW